MLGAWIRRYVRDSVLAGVQDALDRLTGGGDTDAGEQVALLEVRLAGTPSLPAPADDQADAPAKPARKAR